MSVKCGNCHNTHDTAADVRSCYVASARIQGEERRAVTRTPAEAPDWRPGADRAPTQQYGKRGEPWPYPPGRYAILVPRDADLGKTDDLVTKFYKVDTPDEDSRWFGYVFVKVQAGDELYPVKGEAAQVVLRKIAEDPEAAMLLYGREIGKCGHCGRTLTNEESREAGIGPICRGKVAF